jgi:hypothetical protein
VLTPKLVGDRIGLHPVAVIFSVLAGGQLFGFVGILLALPAAAVIMVLLRQVHQNYRESSLYGDGSTDPVSVEEAVSIQAEVLGDEEIENPELHIKKDEGDN